MENILNSPIFGILLTCVAFIFGTLIKKRFTHPLINAYLISMSFVIVFLLLAGIPYESYNYGAEYIAFLMGPATVALAVPLYRQWEKVMKNAKVIFVSTVIAAVTGILSSSGIAFLLGAERNIVHSLSVKSITMPIAIKVVEGIGGISPIAIVGVALTGLIGTVLGPEILDLFKVKSPVARGLALGGAAHVLGTSRAVQEGETQGAFGGIALALTGVFTALLVPFLISLF